MTDASPNEIPIPNSVAGVLCVMSSPLFKPQHIKPLDFAAIGSSGPLLTRTADWHWACRAIAEHEVLDVGGMYPCVKIDQRGVVYLTTGKGSRRSIRGRSLAARC
jgi:hypothetical protein